MQPIVVYGAGGMGREVAETILSAIAAGQPWELLGFLDDAAAEGGGPREILHLPVLGPGEWLSEHSEVIVALGVGHPRVRRCVRAKVEALGGRWATVIHPSAVVMPSATIGVGSVLFAGCTVSSCAKVGELAYINYNAVVSHDVQLGDAACIMAHVALSGNVVVGESAFVGVGVSTRQGISIGEWSIVGAGACVVQDIPPLCVATGVPAQPRRFYASPDEMPPY